MADARANIFPGLHYRDAQAGIAFLERVFGFERMSVYEGENGRVDHAELRLGPGIVMANTGTPLVRAAGDDGTYTEGLSVYVADIEGHYERAVREGATIIMPLETKDYGGAGYAALDSEGHQWFFGSYYPGDFEGNDTRANVSAYLCVDNAEAALAFYAAAFGAVEKYRIPWEGRIGHAEIAVGQTVLMLSDEAPELGVLSPKTLGGAGVAFVLEVPDLDAAWATALAAGATVNRDISEAPYGRGGWLLDPFGFRWNLMTPNPAFDPASMA